MIDLQWLSERLCDVLQVPWARQRIWRGPWCGIGTGSGSAITAGSRGNHPL